MRNLKKIKSEIVNTYQVKNIVEVFEEIAALQMKRIRDEILGSRQFLEGLANLSNEVGSDLLFDYQSKTSATVYLSASSGMYGDLPEKVFNSFLKHIEEKKTSVFIFGKQGKSYMEKYKPNLKFTFYDLDDDKKLDNYLTEIFNILGNFNQIVVFYGKFNNIVNQEATYKSILGEYRNWVSDTEKKDLPQKRFKYIYEPSVFDVSEKFATEIKASIFEGMIKENNLAKTASRLMHLDKAYDTIDKRLFELELYKIKENKKNEDKKQQERIKRLWVR